MKKLYQVDKATVSTGTASFTVYGETARIVNAFAIATVAIVFLVVLSRLIK